MIKVIVNLNFSKGLLDEPQWFHVYKLEEVVFLDSSFLVSQMRDLIDRMLMASHSTKTWNLMLIFHGLGLMSLMKVMYQIQQSQI